MPALSLHDVRFGYGPRSVLDALSLDIHHGEFVAMIGPNGCGKSTALKLMAGLLVPESGRIALKDEISGERPVSSLPRRKLARRLAILAQSNQAPEGMIVRDLVGMGRFAHEGWFSRDTQDDRRHVTAAMQRMKVEDLADRRIGELSGGQLQRCRMAMTLAQNADILLLDEPTNNLDMRHQYALLETARDEARSGRAVVCVLHDLTQASLYADRIVLMSEGRIVADGAPAVVLTPERIEDVYGVRTVGMPFGKAMIHLPESALR